jgi:tetratricopeptide (TPR) repeat protein
MGKNSELRTQNSELRTPFLDVLQSLLDKSLLRQEAGPDDEPRFAMLDTIREYAWERLLDSGEATPLRDHHLAYYLRLVESATRERVFDVLDVDQDNVRAALSWSFESDKPDVSLRLASAMWQYWECRGYYGEGRDWLQRALAAGEGVPDEIRAAALLHAGQAASIQGDHVQGAALIEASIRLFEPLGECREIVDATCALGVALRDLGDYERARTVLEPVLDLSRKLGHTRGLAVATGTLGCIARNRGDFAHATRLLEESRALYRRLQDTRGVASALHDLGETAQLQGDHARAATMYTQSMALFQEIGHQVMVGWSLHNQAYLAYQHDDDLQADMRFRESLRIFRDLGTKDGSAACLAGLARGAALKGDAPRAARLLGAAESICEPIGGLFAPIYATEYGQIVLMARSRLDETAFGEAWAAGRAMSCEEAVDYALGRADDGW